MDLVLVLLHKPLCMHVFKGLIRCKSICDVKPGLDPYPLLARSWERWWLDFVSFIAHKKVKIKFKKAKCVSNRCNDLFKRKKYFGFRCTLKFPLCGFENWDIILRDWAKDNVQKRLEHWTGMRSSKQKEKSVSFLENNSEKILEQSQQSSETKPNTKLVLKLAYFKLKIYYFVQNLRD